MHYSLTYQLAKRNITRPPALQWVYLDRVQANLKLHSSEHDYDKKNYQCTQPGAWGLQRKEHCTFTQRRNQSFKKKKEFKAKYLYSLKRSYWQFLYWNFSWGMDTHAHTHIYIILIRLLYYLPLTSRIEKKFKKKNTTKNLQNTEENMQNTLWNVSMDWLHYRLFSWELVFVTFQYVRCEVWEHHMRKKNPYLSSRRTGLRNFCCSNIFWGFSSLALGVE